MRWRLLVRGPDDSPLYDYGPEGADGDGGIVGFPSFDIDESGNCLTLSFSAVAKRCFVTVRDILILQRYDDSTSAWVNWWRGIVSIAGTYRNDEPQTYQALGLKQVFYERVLITNRWPEAPALSIDAAELPSFNDITLIPGVTRDANSTPTLGFQVGVVLPNRQTFGDFLDARARLVGSFIVPIGETYDYDGVTYNAGDEVPAVRWGVDADGYFFFRRFDSSLVEQFFNEEDPEVEVTWSPLSSEDKPNLFTFVLLGGVDRERLLAAKITQSYSGPPSYGTSFVSTEQTFIPYVAIGPTPIPNDPVIEKPINVQNPLDYMARENMTFLANNLWSNVANAADGDLTTFAEYGGTFTPITATGGTITNVGDYRIHTFTAGGTFTVSALGSNPEVEYLIVAGGGGGGRAATGEAAGGGGAGGLLAGVFTVTATGYSITVGNGGAGGATDGTRGTDGQNSSAFSLTATGGGGGGASDGLGAGRNGGSGGGGATVGTVSRAGGTGTVGQGNNGGTAVGAPGFESAGGGGGAGAAAPSASNVAGAGGLGLESSISGSAVTYATGGAGALTSGGTSGSANTGNGGQGGINTAGGSGGSGVVIIRYRTVAPPATRSLGEPFDFGSPTILESDPVTTLGAGAFVLWYSGDQPTAFAVKRDALLTGFVTIDMVISSYSFQTEMELQFEYPSTNTDTEIRPRQIVIPALSPTTTGRNDMNQTGNSVLYILGTTGLRIYDCAWYQADAETIQRVSESLSRDPFAEAAVVNVQGYYPLAPQLDITPLEPPNTPVVMPVERVEYTLTVNDGVLTRYYAGQRFDPALQTEAAVLNSLVRRLTRTVDQL